MSSPAGGGPSDVSPLRSLYRDPSYHAARELFTSRRYAEALERFRPFAREHLVPKSRAMVLARIVDCHIGLQGTELERRVPRAGPSPAWLEVLDCMRAYLPLLAGAEAEGMALQPAQSVMAGVIALALAWEPEPEAVLRELHELTPQAALPLLLSALAEAVLGEARNYERPGHVDAALRLGELFLELGAASGDRGGARVAVLNRLAETLYFQSGPNPKEVVHGALGLLDRALVEEPANLFASRLREHIRQREATILQIQRFRHDAGSKVGALKQALEHLEGMPGMPPTAALDLARMRANVEGIGALHRLVAEEEPELQECDPAAVCRSALVALGLSTVPVVEVGRPHAWNLHRPYTLLALENLLKNSLEAYARRSLPRPEQPVRVLVDHQRHAIELSDQAGGVDPDLPDPFLPHVSSKGIHQGAGLGLCQAREALRLQADGALELTEQQPSGGACFVLRFVAGP